MVAAEQHPQDVPVILVLDGDRSELDAMERDLRERYGPAYGVIGLTAEDAALAACKGFRDAGRRVALLLAACHDGHWGTSFFLEKARGFHPDASRVLLTTHEDAEAAMVALNQIGLDRYLVRPWHPAEEKLYPVLDRLLSDWRGRAAVPYLPVSRVMNAEPIRIPSTATLHAAAEVVASTGVGDLMVVEPDSTFIGVLSEGDILRNALPDLDEIVAAGSTLHDAFQLFLRKSRELSDRPILPLVILEPLVMHPRDHVAKAAVILIERQIRRLPVLDDGRLVGTVSRADICRAVVAAR